MTRPSLQHGLLHRLRSEDARMNSLRVGDRVRTFKESWGDDIVPRGSIGSVAQVRPLAVAFDHDVIGDGTGVWAMMESQVKFHEPLPIRLARRVAIKRGWLASPRMWPCRPGWDRAVDHPDPSVSHPPVTRAGRFHGDAA